ncbi:MAG: Conjugative transfer protein TraW [Rickettsiaceae bacterium]|jgi:conjugal transfer pilus assembly protein TraW|nr:Conjugative transfer protein TraW [Rickettsiaceae bacterium]
MIIRLLLLLACISLSEQVIAKDFGTHGDVFEIEEQDQELAFKQALESREASGQLQQDIETIKQKIIDKVNEPSPVKFIKEADEIREYEFNPTYALTEDVADGEGKILFPKGTKVNMLEKIKYNQTLVFIDGRSEEQIKWFERKKSQHAQQIFKLILVGGSPLKLMERFNGMPVYFDQGGEITTKLRIRAVPCLAWQEGDVFKVREEKASD